MDHPNVYSILIVDDEPRIIQSLTRELTRDGYAICSANGGVQALEILRAKDIGVIISDMMMPEMDGITFLEKAHHLKPDTVRVMLTAYGTLDNCTSAINQSHVFGLLTKPWDSENLKMCVGKALEHYSLILENKKLQGIMLEQHEELKRSNNNLEQMILARSRQLKEALREGVLTLAIAAEAKNSLIGKHIQRVHQLTLKICLKLGMIYEEAEHIALSGMLHDVGKIYVPDHILNKKEKLTEDEVDVLNRHTIVGEKILGNHPYYETAREIARSHHEDWDGGGYPDGLKGDSIPLAARIVKIADVFDNLLHAPWSMSSDRAKAQMRGQSGKIFDPFVMDAFIDLNQDFDAPINFRA